MVSLRGVEVVSGMFEGTYCGNQAFLFDRRAVLRWSPETEDGWVLAQFNDLELSLAYGWHPFPRSDFDLDPPIDWSSEP